MTRDADILQVHAPFPLADIAVALFGVHGKLVVWWHSDIVRQRLFLAIYRPLLRRLLKRADAIIVETEGHISGSDFLPEYKEKCAIIPPGTRFTGEKPGEAPVIDTVTVLFVGRLVYYKGCDVLLEAFEKVSGANLRIVGSGVLEESLKKRAEGFSGKVKFLGSISDDELAQEFASCDIFVLPSTAKSEAFGLVQIEAMSYGKPVINTNLPGGVPYVSIDGITGLTVPPSDAEALAAALQRLIDDKKLRLEFGYNAYERVQKEFTERVMLDRAMTLYQRLVGGKEL